MLENLPEINLEVKSYDVDTFDFYEWKIHWSNSEHYEYFIKNRETKNILFTPEAQLSQEGVKKIFVMCIHNI